jgi:hypothetical protein
MRPRSFRTRAALPSFGAIALAAAAGCAQLIGAEFDGAKLGHDGGGVDGEGLFEGGIIENEGAAPDSPTGLDGADAEEAFDVRTVADGNMLLWLSSDFGVADGGPPDGGPDGAVLAPSWTDQSGSHHDLAQGFGARQPIAVADPDAGFPLIHFERARLASYTSPFWAGPAGTGGTTIVLVSRGEPDSLIRFQGFSTPAYYLIYPYNAKSGTEVPDFTFNVSAPLDHEQRIRTTFDKSAFTVGIARLKLGAIGGMQVFRNGTLMESASILSDAMPPADGLTVGCSYAYTECAEADVTEIMVFGEAITDDDRHHIETMLKKKWGIVF